MGTVLAGLADLDRKVHQCVAEAEDTAGATQERRHQLGRSRKTEEAQEKGGGTES